MISFLILVLLLSGCCHFPKVKLWTCAEINAELERKKMLPLSNCLPPKKYQNTSRSELRGYAENQKLRENESRLAFARALLERIAIELEAPNTKTQFEHLLRSLDNVEKILQTIDIFTLTRSQRQQYQEINQRRFKYELAIVSAIEKIDAEGRSEMRVGMSA